MIKVDSNLFCGFQLFIMRFHWSRRKKIWKIPVEEAVPEQYQIKVCFEFGF